MLEIHVQKQVLDVPALNILTIPLEIPRLDQLIRIIKGSGPSPERTTPNHKRNEDPQWPAEPLTLNIFQARDPSPPKEQSSWKHKGPIDQVAQLLGVVDEALSFIKLQELID